MKWAKDRRACVHELAQECSAGTLLGTSRLARAAGHSEWTPEKKVVVKKEKRKRVASFLQGLHEKTVADEEGTPLGHRVARMEVLRLHEVAAKRAKMHEDHDWLCGKKEPLQLSGARVFVDPTSNTPPQMLVSARAAGATIVTSRVQAHIIIARSPASPGLRNQWAAVLCGAIVAVPAKLGTNGGIAIQYSPAILSKRFLWFSDDFKAMYPNVTRVIDEALAKPSCKWQRLASKADFLEAVRRRIRGPIRQRRPYEALALVTVADKRQQDPILPWLS